MEGKAHSIGAIAHAAPTGFGFRRPGQELFEEAIACIDSAGLRFCVLRDSRKPATAGCSREVDLLLHVEDWKKFDSILTRIGFVPLVSWGYGGHRSYLAYEQVADGWLKLDVVTRLRYGGRSRPLSSPAFEECLTRRQQSPADVWVLDAPDALLALVLHCVLDKRTFKKQHRDEIKRLREFIENTSDARAAVAKRFDAALGPALSYDRTSAAISSAEWSWLLEQRRRISLALFRRQAFAAIRRHLAGTFLRLTRPFAVILMRRGFSVALLGPHGAGKTALARSLAEDVQLRARIIYMGSKLNAGKLGLRLIGQLYQSLVAIVWVMRGRFVVFDQHPQEIAVADHALGWGDRFRRKLLRWASIRPDLTLSLDADANMLYARKSEHAREHLEMQRARYRLLLVPYPRGILVDASGTEADTARQARSAIWNRYCRHVRRSPERDDSSQAAASDARREALSGRPPFPEGTAGR